MRLSQRITTLSPDGDGWDLFYRARAMVRAGQPVTELTIGEPDTRTDPAILDAMARSAAGGHTGYADVPGIPALRAAIAARTEARTGVPTTPEQVIVTSGGQAALFAAHMAALDPGDRALHIEPYYTTYPGTIRATGGVPVAVKTRPETGFQPTAADLDAAAAGARTLLVNTPNNPTGAVYSHATCEAIAATATRHDLTVISDEVYDTQVWQGEHLSPRALPGMAQRTMVIGSMSKIYAMTGSRIGWIIAPETAIARLISLSLNTTYGVPGFVQDAALFALEQGDRLAAQVAAPFRRRRDLAVEMLSRQQALTAMPPSGTMYMMLDVRATGLDGAAFADLLLDQHGIAVMPGASFGRAATGQIRVALTVPDDRFATAFATLCDVAAGLAEGR